MMSKKTMLLTTGLYIFCALIWTVNFFLHWNKDGAIGTSTVLYGISAVCFAIAAVLNVIRLVRAGKTEREDK